MFKKVTAGFVAICFVFAAVLVLGMSMSENEQMSGCPFMSNDQSVCTMTGVEHMTKWAQTFTADRANFAKAVFAAFAMIFASSGVLRDIRLKLQRKKNYFVKLFDRVLRALADGTLHPRVYNLAIV